MILQSETTLTTEEYNAILASKGESPAFNVILYKVVPDFSESDVFTAYNNYDFGTCIYNGELWRVNGSGDVIHGDGVTWTTATISAVPNLNNLIALSLVTDDTDLYAYACGTDGIYERVYSGGSWAGSWTQIVASTTVIAMASAAPDSVYYVEYDATFHSLPKYWNGTTSTFSGIYWPYKMTSIGVTEIAAGRDCVTATSPMPGVVKYKYANNQVFKESTRSYGIVSFMVIDDVWSEHREIEYLLEGSTDYRFRTAIKMFTHGDEHFMSVYSRNGTESYSFDGYRLFSTVDGEHWSRSIFIGLPDTSENYGLTIHRIGDLLIACNGGKIFTANSTIYFNHSMPDTELDISDEVLNLSVSRQDMAQVSIELSGATSWFDPSVLTLGGRFWVRVQVGQWIAGVQKYFPVGLFEIDNIEIITTLPQIGIRVTGRDFLSWMADFSEIEDAKNWGPQILGGDKYGDSTNSGYGGMGHSQVVSGIWRTLNNTIRLTDSNSEGIIFNTFPTDIVSPTELWNFRSSVGFQLAKVNNSEYAGICFRGQDKDNLWYAAYNQSLDKIMIMERRTGTGTVRAQSASTLGWSNATTVYHYIMVEQIYSKINVYISTDNINWTLNLTYVADGDAGTFYPQAGYCGPIGSGWSDEGSWSNQIDWPTIGDPIVEFDYSYIAPGGTPLSQQIREGGSIDKVFTGFRAWALDARSKACMIVKGWNPHLNRMEVEDKSGGLNGKGRCGAQNYHKPDEFFALTEDGLFVNHSLFGSGYWQLVATMTEITGNVSFKAFFIAMPKEAPAGYIAAWGHNNLFCYSFDYGETWQQVIIDGEPTEANYAFSTFKRNQGEFFPYSPRQACPINNCIGIAFSPYNNLIDGRVVANVPILFDDVDSPEFHSHGYAPAYSVTWQSFDWGVTWEQLPWGGIFDYNSYPYSTALDGSGGPAYFPAKSYSQVDDAIRENRGSRATAIMPGAGGSNYGTQHSFTPLVNKSNHTTLFPYNTWRYMPTGAYDRPSYWDDFNEIWVPWVWSDNTGGAERRVISDFALVFPDSLNGRFLAVLIDNFGESQYDDGAFIRVEAMEHLHLFDPYEVDVVGYDGPTHLALNPEGGTPYMQGAPGKGHRLVCHKYDNDIVAWWAFSDDTATELFGRMRLSFDMGDTWKNFNQMDFTSFYDIGTEVNIAYFEFDYSQWWKRENQQEVPGRTYFSGEGISLKGWHSFIPAMSNGTKAFTEADEDGLTATYTSGEVGSVNAITAGFVIYIAATDLLTLPLKMRFGFKGDVTPFVIWQGRNASGSGASKVFPDSEGWYKITKKYVFAQWKDVHPIGLDYYEYKK